MKILLPLILVAGAALAYALWPTNPEPTTATVKANAAKGDARGAPTPAGSSATAGDDTEAVPKVKPSANVAEKQPPRPAAGAKGERPNLDAPQPPPLTAEEAARKKAELAKIPPHPEMKAGEFGAPRDGYRTFTLKPREDGRPHSRMNKVGRVAVLKDVKAYRDNLPASGILPRMIKASTVFSEDVMHDLRIGPDDMIRELGDAPVGDREGYSRLITTFEEPAQHIMGLTIIKPDGREIRDYVEVIHEE